MRKLGISENDAKFKKGKARNTFFNDVGQKSPQWTRQQTQPC